MYDTYVKFQQLKTDLIIAKGKEKRKNVKLLEVKSIEDNIKSIKEIIKTNIITRNKELVEKYNISKYIRSDGQFNNLNKLKYDSVFDQIIKDTSFYIGDDIKFRLFILRYNLTLDDITCEAEGCLNHKMFNTSTNFPKNTCLEKHDIYNIIHKKAAAKIKERYQVENPNQIPGLVRNNKNPHNITNHPMRNNITNIEDYNEEGFKKFIINGQLDIIKLIDYFNIGLSTAYVQLKNYDIKYNINSPEKRIMNFLDKHNIKYTHNDRKLIAPLEIDILIPSHKIAIEFNGIYWHSYGTNNTNTKQGDYNFCRSRHLIKTEACEKLGYKLFHIFEKEDFDLWFSVLSNALKLNSTVYARKCTIKEICPDDSSLFENQNHLQGYRVSSIRYALYYDDEIVSEMTFSKSAKKEEYELVRFCNKKYISVVGGASKLLKHFEKTIKPRSIVTYANRRYSNGALYDVLGFDFIKISKPNYFYISPNMKIHSRLKFQKHKLANALKCFDENLTETQNMINNNYRILFDSGNKVYTKYFDENDYA